MTAPMPRIGERSSWDRVLAALEARSLITRRRGDSRVEFRCPCHDDGRASATADYKPGEPGRVLLCCHSTDCPAYRNGQAIAETLGLAPADLFDGPPPPGSSRRPRTARPRPATTPVARRGVRPQCPEHSRDWRQLGGRVSVTEHSYVGTAGELLARVVRKKCAACGDKDVRPDRSGWAEADRVLYRLPEVLAAIASGATIYVTEGEANADAIAALGATATTNPFGADDGNGAKWLPHHTAALGGAARVVVIADNDPDGYAHAAFVAGELASSTTPPVEVVEVVRAAVETPKADVVDHLAAGGTLETLLPCDPYARLAELEGEPEPRPAAVPRIGPKPRPVEGSPDWRFIQPGEAGEPGAVERLMGRGEDRGWYPVVKSCPRVVERLATAADSTTRDRRHYTLRWGEDEATVSYADLISGDAWDKFPDAIGTGDKPVRAALANVIMTQGAALPRTLAATRTGWHDDDKGRRYYLHPDGRTFPDGRKVRLIGAPARLAEAAAPRGVATDDELRQALADIVQYGRAAGLLGLASGARSLGQSIRPVPAALAVHGDPFAGKSALGWHARSLVLTPAGARMPGWPPLPTKSFTATRTDLEFAANFEADLPALFEDLALPGNASAIEVREANGKLEALIRPLANQDEIRGRRSRDLLPGPANYVRSIPVITAERMPPTMMESLYRRAVVPRIRKGQLDTAWYGANSSGLLTPLRTLGARVIERLYELDADAAEQLGRYGAAAYSALGAAIGSPAWLTDVPAMAGVVDAAASIVSGLYLIADVVPGIDPAALADPVVTYLAEALGEQAEVMADRRSESGSLAEAVGQVLTRALAARRSYVCDRDGRPAPLVPGLAPSEQGLRQLGGHLAAEWEGQGVPLYWLADRSGVGVRSAALHGLLAEYHDARAAGLTPRSLPEALLRDGGSLPNTTQRGTTATHHVRIGDGTPRLVLLRPELLTGDSPRVVAISSGTSGTTDTPQVSGLPDGSAMPDATEKWHSAGQTASEQTATVPPVEPSASPTSAIAAVPLVPERTGTQPEYVTSVDRFAAPAVVADAEDGYLARPDRLDPVPVPSPMTNLAHAGAWALRLRLGLAHEGAPPDDPVLVILPDLAARLGLPASPPERGSKAARTHPALAPLREAGWQIGELCSFMRAWRQGGRTARIWLPGWDDYGTCPMWGDGVPAPTLAYRLGLFAELLGIGWRLTGGSTGVDLAGTFRRKTLRLAAGVKPPQPAAVAALEPDYTWSRKPESDEASSAWVHCYDQNAMYLGAYGQASVNLGHWQQVERPAFNRKLPGYWLADLPEHADRMLPDPLDPTGRAAATGTRRRWLTTASLAYAVAELGYTVEPIEAWLPADSASYGRWYEPWAARLSAARSAVLPQLADADAEAVYDSYREVWKETHGLLCAPTQREQFRPDHRHVIMATARVGLARRLVRIAEAEQRWPLAIATDNLAYASNDPDPLSACPANLALGDHLGQFKVKGTLPMAVAAPLLGTGRMGDVTKLFELAEQHLTEHAIGAEK